MPRALVLSNGQLSVCLDQFGFVRDMYFPYVGLENHVAGKKHRIGVWINSQFSWLDDGSWQISISYKPETMVGILICKNEQLQLSLVMEDSVYNETNVFQRKVDIYNHSKDPADIRLFFGAEFMISEGRKRNTAFYDPTHNAIVHYKGRRVFIINGRTSSGGGIDEYTVGSFEDEGKEGSFRDAEDGSLTKNAVEHGSVDSVVRFCVGCEAGLKTTIYYWVCAGKTLNEAYALNQMVLDKSPESMLHSTEEFWRAWLNKRDLPFEVLTPEQKKLFDTSLFILRAHTDNRGAIIASADSEMIEYGKDDYSYMWPRDAAYIASVLDKAGYTEVTKPFFLFCRDVLHEDGYLHHRYRSDQSLGSTWHSTIKQTEWLKNKILQLPIQEDETAGVLHSLWVHYQATKDIEFIESLYKPMIEKMANFLVSFRDQGTGLPLHSYDLWEEKIGVATYTCAATYGGLMAAASFSEMLGKRNHMREYIQAAKELKKATADHLFSRQLNSFVRIGYVHAGQVSLEEIVDASTLFGLWYFGMFDQDDPLLFATETEVKRRLKNPGETGGYIRYEHDSYFKDTDLANPWIITTLWEAQRVLARPVVSDEELQFVRQTIDWAVKQMYVSGVLPEQMNPHTGVARSATPLVWSHAVYVETILMLLDKLRYIGLIRPHGWE